MTIAEKMQRQIQEISVELCREMYGEDECPPLGTRFSQIENDAISVADAISREVMQNLLAKQAAQAPQATLPCPDCGGPCERCDEDIGQNRLTRRGNVEWSEPKYYCTKCRRSFFPGDRRPGADS
jgi:uncharacterized protein with PIN domain